MGGMTCRASLIKGKYAGEPRAEGLHGSGGHVTQSYSTVVWEVGDCTTLLNTPEFSSFPEICYQIYRRFNKMYFKQSTKITTIKTAKLSLINGSSLKEVGCSIGEGFFSEYIVVFFFPSVAVFHWTMTEVEVIVYPTLHWYVYVNTAQETDKARIQRQFSRRRKGGSSIQNAKHPFVNWWTF